MSKRKGFIAALVGVTTGYLAGILTAPKSGKQTRKKVKRIGTKAAKDAEKRLKSVQLSMGKQAKELDERAKSLRGKAKTELSELRDSAKELKDRAETALHDIKVGLFDKNDVESTLEEAEATKKKIAAVKRCTTKK